MNSFVSVVDKIATNSLNSGKEGNLDCPDMNKISSVNWMSKIQSYNVSDFGCCQLVEKNVGKRNLKCVICRKLKKNANTKFMCSTCDTGCCIGCYDHHRKQAFLFALRKLQTENEVSIELSKCGNFLETKLKTQNDKLSAVEKNGDNVEKNANGFAVKDTLSASNFLSNSDYSKALIPIVESTFANVKSAISLLKESYGAVSETLFNTEGKLNALYFQDSQMKDFFNFYPRRICIDVTCKLISLDLCLFLSEDSNGQNEIISVALVSIDDRQCLMWLLATFKKHNPCWREIKMLIVDSLIRNREILRSCFPDAHILISFYHSTRTFKRDLSSGDICNISNEERASIIQHFEKMVLVYSEMDYSLLYQQLLSTYDSSVYDYFNKNWHPIRQEWRIQVECCHDILYALNGFLKLVESAMKPLLSVQVTLCEVIEKFFFALKLLRSERNHKNPTIIQSGQLSLYSKFTSQYQISKLLTPYAAEFVIHQLDISAEININPGVPLESYIFCRFGTTAVANSSTCTCKFFLLTSLFCCHIFAVRRVLSMSVFDVLECDVTWTQKYFQDTHASLGESLPSLPNSSNYSLTIIDKLSSAMINSMPKIFEYRMSLLDQLVVSSRSSSEVYLQFDGINVTKIQNDPVIAHVEPHLPDLNLCAKEEVNENEHCYSKLAIVSTDKQNTSNAQQQSKPSFLDTDWKFGRHLLEGAHINLVYLSRVICKTKKSCIEWLQHMELLPKSMSCPSCGRNMKHENVTRLSDGIIWICTSIMKNRKSCAKRRSVRCSTWFEATNMSLEQILFFTYLWINSYPASHIVFELGISAATFNVWDKFFRRVCWFALQNTEYSKEQGSNLNSGQLLDTWLQSINVQDGFIMFLKDASNFYSGNKQSIQSM